MFKYDEFEATSMAYQLAKTAIESGFLATPIKGTDAGKNVIAFMDAIVDGLIKKNEGPNQQDE